MQTLNYNELMSICGGGLIKNVIQYVKFIKYCIWEYFDSELYD